MKILFSATVVKTHINTFHQPFLKLCKEMGWETSVCAKNDFENKDDCKIQWCDKYYDMPFERFPFKLKNIKVFFELRKLIKEEKYDIIHCHTPSAGVITRLAAATSGVKKVKVIYTAHGFHFFKGAPLINWLVYFPVEWICSFMTDVLITINDEDFRFAKNHMHAKEVEYVHGVGVDLEKFSDKVMDEQERIIKRSEIGLNDDDIMIFSVGELIVRKNHETVIKAIANIKNPNIKYFICGRGVLKDYLQKFIEKLHLSDRIKLLGFRKDISELCNCADIFVLPSYQEGLPVALMEAIATGVPVVASNIRGNNDLVKDGINGCLVKADDAEAISEKVVYLIKNKEIAKRFAEKGKQSIKKFDITFVKDEIKEIYERVSQS